MNAIFAVAVGGAIGATGRYLFNLQMLRLLGPNFPWGTFGVNVIGSFIMGLVAGLFALDAAIMIERGQTGLAALYIGGSVVLGLAGLFFGLWIARAMFPA